MVNDKFLMCGAKRYNVESEFDDIKKAIVNASKLYQGNNFRQLTKMRIIRYLNNSH